ncbi:MAG: FeoA family protein [Chloroflexi bacterium]|nr:FeoA family protein [Chloroflexota bacterium]
MIRKDLTPAMEDYLKGAYLLRERGEDITVLALAEALKVTPPSVTGMVKRLAGLGLIEHTPYRLIELTPAGTAVALEIVRHHRLLELYLAEFLGMAWDEVHSEADRLEHHISEDLEERIAERLGQPAIDPHGDPIPARDLTLPERDLVRLSALRPGVQATIARVSNQEPGLLHYLGTLGMVPGAVVTFVEVAPYGNVVTVKVGAGKGAVHSIAGEVASRVLTMPTSDEVAAPH